MKRTEVATQDDLERVLKEGNRPICVGSGRFEALGSARVVARGSARVVARGSAHVAAWESAHVEACGSAHVKAWGSAHVVARESAHVVAWESAHVEAWESAHVVAWGSAHVVARGSAHVVAWESAHVEAAKFVSVHRQSQLAKIEGGVVIDVQHPTTAQEWCEFYGVAIINSVATLFKAVDEDFKSRRGGIYIPGTQPEAPDWDGGSAECRGGFNFSPHPLMALDFTTDAKRFVACPVAIEDCRAPRAGDTYPQKIKARRICGPIIEVDRYGKPVT